MEDNENEVTETGAEETEVVEETSETDAEGTDDAGTDGEGDAEGEASDDTEGEGEESEETEGEEGDAEGDAEGEESDDDFKPTTKFKAGVWNKETKSLEQKEYEIDPKFHAIMKDPESEKLVRELHEKAFGLESIKERFNETRQTVQSLNEENRAIKSSIDGVRNLYQSAVSSGNLHKLDFFFQKLNIPQGVILQYAMAKVEMNEMSPEQRQVLEAKLHAEKRAEDLAAEQETAQSLLARQTVEMKQVMVDAVLERPAVAALAEEYDTRKGTPGAFKAAVFREGQLAWHTEGIDLPPAEAVKRAIENLGLSNGTHNLPPGKETPAGKQNGAVKNNGVQNPQSTANGGKKVVRTDKTIPNISGRSTSPLPSKMKSVDDIVKYRKEQYGG